MRKGLIEGNFESTAVKSGAINQLESLLAKLLFVLKTKGVGYRQILLRSRGEAFASDCPVTLWAWLSDANLDAGRSEHRSGCRPPPSRA